MDARPVQGEMEQANEAINNFLQLLEKQEKKGFKDLATLQSLLTQLPKPAPWSALSKSVVEAMEAGFLPALDEDQDEMFTLYWHQ